MTQTHTFNLVDECWIPCVLKDGMPRELSLRDVFVQAHKLQGIAGDTPLVTVALHRLLLAILHRNFGPVDYDEWHDLWRAKQWNMARLDNYFDKWRHRFDLFDEERPFYQSPTLYLESKPISAIRLIHHMTAPDTLFDHHNEVTGVTLNPSEAARALATIQAFGLCGLSGAFDVTNRKKKQAAFYDAAISRGITFLIQGNTLFETLMLNLIQYPDNEPIPLIEDEESEGDIPAWERDDPCSHNRSSLSGYLDYLTWHNRRILLCPEHSQEGTVVKFMRWEPSRRMGSNVETDSERDPMQYYIFNKNKKALYSTPMLFKEGKALWRDSSALFSLHHNPKAVQFGKSISALPPYTFQWLYELVDEGYLPREYIYHCVALGMSSKGGEAKVYFYRDERMPFPLVYLADQSLVTDLDTALAQTERVAGVLRRAVRRAGMFLQLPNPETTEWPKVNKNAQAQIQDWVRYTGIERIYWSALEIPFRRFMVDLTEDRETALAGWRTQLQQTAVSAFEQIGGYVGDDGRSLKAMVRGRQALNYNLRQILASPKEDQI